MPKDNIKHLGFMDTFFLATTPRSTIRGVKQIAAAEKANTKKLDNKTCKVNQADTKKPVINQVERKREGGKTPEQVPRINLCTPCALFMPVYVSEIIFFLTCCMIGCALKSRNCYLNRLFTSRFPNPISSLPSPLQHSPSPSCGSPAPSTSGTTMTSFHLARSLAPGTRKGTSILRLMLI